MSNLETLLNAWLNDGEVPAGFQPETRIEEYLVAILEGVDDSVTPESRADVLLDAIATKYAGYADGIANLEDELGVTAIPPTPQQLATLQAQVNEWHLQSLADKGITPEEDNTFQILAAYEQNWPSGGAELNIAFGDTAPEDTSKLWIKTAQPQNVTVDYDVDNSGENIETLTTVLSPAAWAMGCGTVGKKCYLFGGMGENNPLAYSNVFDTETNVITALPLLPNQIYFMACGVVGTKIYLFGGYHSGAIANIYMFDTETNAITPLGGLPRSAYAIGSGVVGTKIYLFGGNSSGAYLDTINVFDTETNTISTLSSVTLPTAASNIACGVVGTKCYLFGGNSNNGRLNTIRVFDSATTTITTLAATLPSAASSIACGAVGTKIYLFGGLGNAIAVFDTETETITTLSTTLPIAASSIACGVVGANCYLFGGYANNLPQNTIDKFTVTFPLSEGDIYLQSDVFKNKFTLVTAPTEVETGVSAVYVGNAQNEAENAEAYLHDGTAWQPIT